MKRAYFFSTQFYGLILMIAFNPLCLSSQRVLKGNLMDSLPKKYLNEIVVSASRFKEPMQGALVSMALLNSYESQRLGAVSSFDALEFVKGIQVITPSLGFKVLNSRGFINTTNVRFVQLVDGIDVQAPHMGAAIANSLGASELDILNMEHISGTASSLYGMNAINGLINIRTKNPFDHQGLSFQKLTGLNHLGKEDPLGFQFMDQTHLRFASKISKRWAYKMNGSYVRGSDWGANNCSDMAHNLNSSTGLGGIDNPAKDEVNSYGNESPNRKTLTLNGKNYVVSRTGYRELDLTDYSLANAKADVGLFFRPKIGQELVFSYKGATINNIYQRSNRFQLSKYQLHQASFSYQSVAWEVRTYLTYENTGNSYNLRSLAENMDRAFKSDNQWFSDYSDSFYEASNNGMEIASAHNYARTHADEGRYLPGSSSFNSKKEELIQINNWDIGAALRVKSFLLHHEAIVNWEHLFPVIYKTLGIKLQSAYDARLYLIVPDGNYFINPLDSEKNLSYKKIGSFTQLNKSMFQNKLRLNMTLRADKCDYFSWKLNPRISALYVFSKAINVRFSYQSGNRYPSIFEGFSNVNSGGVKRVGGLPIMSNGIFENSYTKASIETFQLHVNEDVNLLGMTQEEAIEKNKDILKKNPYTYLQPEFIRSFEWGLRGLLFRNKLSFDLDVYYNSYENFIAQIEANVPLTLNLDSIPTFLYYKSKQNRYRLWTNSQGKIYNYGASLQVRFTLNDCISILGNATYAHLDRKVAEDGLEEGFNSPKWMLNETLFLDNVWKGLGLSVTTKYQSSFDYVSFLVSGKVDQFWTMDAQLSYRFLKQNFLVKVGASNLLNRPYYSMLGGAQVGGMYYCSVTYGL